MNEIQAMVDRLESEQNIERADLEILLSTDDEAGISYLKTRARAVADKIYGKCIFIRGLIEFTNYCKNDCFYCGIRKSNLRAERYRLDTEDILACCEQGYALGFRTFVLQGGEDMYYTDERMCRLIAEIRERYPDCALTLSIGERERESYEAFFDAGADRYLLRHETADEAHYGCLHPKELSLAHRMECLRNLKEIGYQVGCGFMVGSPGQSVDTLYEDLQFIRELKPQMVGIGPFIPHRDTPFRQERAGTLEMTLRLLAVIRLMQPHVLLPATTALGTIHEDGREHGILVGANVVMPNLSPTSVREKYSLYDNKRCTDSEAAEGKRALEERMARIGYEVVVDRGDYR